MQTALICQQPPKSSFDTKSSLKSASHAVSSSAQLKLISKSLAMIPNLKPNFSVFLTICTFALLFLSSLVSPTKANAADGGFNSSIDYTMFRLATEHNDPSAQYLVGRNYLLGKTVEKNISEALKWLNLASDQNHKRAQHQLGMMYLKGGHVKKDINKAINYLAKAASNDHLESQFQLGKYYSTNGKVKQAVQLLRTASDDQHLGSMFLLGKILFEGQDIEEQPLEGRRLIKLAADSGEYSAAKYLRKIGRPSASKAKILAKLLPPDMPSSTSPSKTKTKNIAKSKPKTNKVSTKINNSSNKKKLAKTKPAPSKNKNKNQNKTQPVNIEKSKTVKYKQPRNRFNITDSKIERDKAETQYSLAMAYLAGTDMPKKPNTAAELLQIAANNGLPKAQYQLALLYRDGIGLKKNKTESVRWLKFASANGVEEAEQVLKSLLNQRAKIAKTQPSSSRNRSPAQTPNDQYSLAMKYVNGIGVPKNPTKAAELLLMAAQQDHSESQFKLGKMYQLGVGVDTNDRAARKWLRKAAKSGLKKASFELERMQLNSTLSNTKTASTRSTLSSAKITPTPITETTSLTTSITTPTKTLTTASTRSNSKKAASMLASRSFTGMQTAPAETTARNPRSRIIPGDSTQLISIMDLASKGDVEAQYKVGVKYFEGQGVQRDLAKGLKWIKAAADNNNLTAMIKLGDIYFEGYTGIDKDLSSASQWYERAAKKGDPQAQLLLGDMYKHGFGMKKSNTKAIKWYRKSANRGNKEARKRMGGCRIC